jgi:predicted nucleic acid-binding protein
MVLELAIAGSASIIITDNTKDFRPASQFGIEIQTPYAFIEKTTLL